MIKYENALKEMCYSCVYHGPDCQDDKCHDYKIFNELIEKYKSLQDENARLNLLLIESNIKEMNQMLEGVKDE